MQMRRNDMISHQLRQALCEKRPRYPGAVPAERRRGRVIVRRRWYGAV